MPFPNTRLTASLYATMSITFWGVSFVSTKAVLEVLDPFSLLVVRFGIGSTFLFCFIHLLKENIRVPLKYLPHLLSLGVLGVFVHQVIQASALLTIQASAAGWLISFSPIFTVLLSIVFLKEHLTRVRAVGITIAVSGVLLITTLGSGQSFSFALSIGYFLMILSTFNWAVYSVLLKKLAIPLPSIVITFYMSMCGFLLTLPFLIRNQGFGQLVDLEVYYWGHLLFLGVFVSALAYWYWAKALEIMEASQVSVFLYLEPLATLIAAVLLLKENFSWLSITGGWLIIFGVLLVQGRLRFLFQRN
ncbi:DMT family transporter [Halobacillus sp. B29]|uniref:DMT family transporter n=1 Tax=Halobacillus sp. B29 TaxID=3457432 RepID=UPI003FCE4F7B